MPRNSSSTIEQRRKQLLAYISQRPDSNVSDMVADMHCSPATIRRDLNQLLRARLITRTNTGKFAPMNETIFDSEYHLRYSAHHYEKAAIAQKAIEFVSDGDSIGIDFSTTCLEFSKLLTQKKNISVLTNNLFVPQFLARHNSLQLFLVGGYVNLQLYSTEGQIVCKEIAQHNFDIAFFSCTGLDFTVGLTSNLRDIESQLAIIRQAAKKVLLLDSSKIGVRAAP